MSFTSLTAGMDANILSLLSSPVSVTIHFKDAYPDLILPAVTKNPAYEEDYVPGSPASSEQGVTVLILFVHLTPAQVSVARLPLTGDTSSYGGADYDIFRIGTDREDGRTLYLRRRTERWDQ